MAHHTFYFLYVVSVCKKKILKYTGLNNWILQILYFHNSLMQCICVSGDGKVEAGFDFAAE